MKVDSFFELPEGTIKRERRCGNSTRLCDHIIQLLFRGYTVQVKDHHRPEGGAHDQQDLFKKVIRRLETEHGGSQDFYTADKGNLTISLL